ncbi:MAG: hypothetical protein R2733_10760 [Acidimicrobiales bacterium]
MIDLRSDTAQRRKQRAEPTWTMHVFGIDGALGAAAVELERAVFWEEYGNSVDLMKAEYEPYDDRSVFTGIVHTPTNELVGLFRFITGPAGELKSVRDLRTQPEWCFDVMTSDHPHAAAMRTTRLIDIATLSVAPEWRTTMGGAASWLTIGMLPVASRLLRAESWVTVLDERVSRVLRRVCGFTIERVADLPSVRYLDSPSSFAGFYDFSRFDEDFRTRIADVQAMVDWRFRSVTGGLGDLVIDVDSLSKRQELPQLIL